MLLIHEIQQSHSTLPIVHDDPELKRPGNVQDVTAKPPQNSATVALSQRKLVKNNQ